MQLCRQKCKCNAATSWWWFFPFTSFSFSQHCYNTSFHSPLVRCCFFFLFEWEVYGNWPEGFQRLANCISNQCQDCKNLCKPCVWNYVFIDWGEGKRLQTNQAEKSKTLLFLCIVNISSRQRWQHHTNEGRGIGRGKLINSRTWGGKNNVASFFVLFSNESLKTSSLLLWWGCRDYIVKSLTLPLILYSWQHLRKPFAPFQSHKHAHAPKQTS